MTVASSFIADADLQTYLPAILTYGVSSFALQNLAATDDIVSRIEAEWWPDAIARRFSLAKENNDMFYATVPIMNVSLLDSATLKPLVAYRSLSHYIMPMLAADADDNGDMFSRRATRYNNFYLEEWNKVVKLPIYDFNQDASFTTFERKGPPVKRLLRA